MVEVLATKKILNLKERNKVISLDEIEELSKEYQEELEKSAEQEEE